MSALFSFNNRAYRARNKVMPGARRKARRDNDRYGNGNSNICALNPAVILNILCANEIFP
jgi:hypothetical protein